MSVLNFNQSQLGPNGFLTGFDNNSLNLPFIPSSQTPQQNQGLPGGLNLGGSAGSRATINGQTFTYGDNGWMAAPAGTPAAGTSGNTAGDAATQNPWTNTAPFGGQNPWVQNAAMPYQNNEGSGINTYASPQNPNINYVTESAAKQLAQMFGGNLLQSNGAGAPLYGIDFGTGDPVNAGQLAFWLQRGDDPALIAARVNAGINNPLVQSGVPTLREGNQSWNWNPISTNLPQGGVSTLAGGKVAPPANSPFASANWQPIAAGNQPAPIQAPQRQNQQSQQFFGGNNNYNPLSSFGYNPMMLGSMGGLGEFLALLLSAAGQQQPQQRPPAFSGYGQLRGRQPFSNSFYYPAFM